ncbi:glycosyltransferase [Acetobacterium malicum]|uniref:Glycosyltransferase n=1 Tax=Acetobacterium malicum TaxID=52692 RepID=A0ABR6YU13_9FIRM|nr:glycosyltransferase [Acetobacterium malicum]MBC3898676.1 glycosyltransferase [Acetobacterium malicum]
MGDLKMLIGSVVVLYNPTEDEIKNINFYINKVDYAFVIDNSSKDSSELMKKYIDDVNKLSYIHNAENVGLCRALNQGVKLAVKNGCQWTVVFDADSRMSTDVFEIYSNTIEKYKNIENVAVFAPQHSFHRNKKNIYSGYKEIDWAMTSGWLINNDVFKKMNGFFEPLFVDGLDLDYCYYAREKGYKIIECGEAMIDHHPAISKTFRFLFMNIQLGTASPFRYYLQAKCLVWDYKRYHHFFDLKMYFIKWVKVLLFFDNKKEYMKNMLLGTIDGVKLHKKFKQGLYPNRI